MNYYNEYDKKMAAWIRGLIAAGLIPGGHVDERSIADVQSSDLSGYTQCHFFCGISGWSYALQLAGWGADRPIWSGSCPCQPYSVAGKGKGDADERNLWPHFFRLIRECRPECVIGEQVASAIGHGWLDGIRNDLDGEGYAVGAVVLAASSVGAPHIRQRLYWVADSEGERKGAVSGGAREGILQPDGSGGISGLVLPVQPGLEGHAGNGDARDESGRVGASEDGSVAAASCGAGGMGDADIAGFIPRGETSETAGYGDPTDAAGFWADSRLVQCRDGKHRRIPTEPALFPLADGLPYRVGKRGSVRPALLHGAGNAIVPQTAAAFIKAFMGTQS